MINKSTRKDIFDLIKTYESESRIALSKRFPFLIKPIVFVRRGFTKLKNFLNPKIKNKKSNEYLKSVVARHQSVLRRKLGDSNPRLQEQKIINLKQAVDKLDGLIIESNKIFSFWQTIGIIHEKKGYVEGMLLSGGKVKEGLGGGLCQLSNFLYWIFLHSPVKIIEHYHHSMDVFPDSGRVLPFGSGATILCNYIDLKVLNISKQPLQIKIWLTDKHLKGQIRSTKPFKTKYHIIEKNHCFIKRGKKYFRYNEIYRQAKVRGKIIREEKITTNFAPVMYKVTDEYLKKNKFEVLDFTGKKNIK
ncbi:MAG: vancomycin resistance protein [Candidatus Magasanikbacteria bacterium]|nr:vancomycin resistance protein [Candidatus Magasanikbacteria bacterium]